MDLKMFSELTRIGVALIVFVASPVYSATCSKYSSSGTRSSYMYCSTSCCGDYYNRYCCSAFSTVYIVLIVIGCALAVFIGIACYCCRRRRALQGTIVSNQQTMQQTVFHSNMMSTVPGQTMQMHNIHTNPGFTQSPVALNHQQVRYPVGQPTWTPNQPFTAHSTPTTNTVQPQGSGTNFGYLSPDPPPYEELSNRNAEQQHQYYDVSNHSQDYSGYETPVRNDNQVYDEIPGNRVSDSSYITPTTR